MWDVIINQDFDLLNDRLHFTIGNKFYFYASVITRTHIVPARNWLFDYFSKVLFLKICKWRSVHVSAGAHECQMRARDHMILEIQVSVNSLEWVLWTNKGVLPKQCALLNSWTNSPIPYLIISIPTIYPKEYFQTENRHSKVPHGLDILKS